MFMLLTSVVHGETLDSRTEATSPTTNDLMYILRSPYTSGNDRKITVDNLLKIDNMFDVGTLDLTSGKLLIADGVDLESVSMSGDCTIDNTGAIDCTLTESDISDLSHTVDTNLTQEEVEDFAGALVTDGTGTHTDITITYQDATGDVDFVVDTLPNLTGTLDVDSGGTGVTSATDDSVLVGNGTIFELKAIGDCDGATNALTYDVTTNAFSCNTIVGGSGDSVSIDSVSVTDPDFQSGGDIDFVDTSNVITANINAGVIVKADLAVSTDFGDVSTDGSSNLLVDADSVALTTDTTGNYVASVTNGTSITGGDGGSEGATLTLDVADDSIDGAELADAITLDATTTIDMDTNTSDLNFDSDTLFIDQSTNRVGIGTSTPTTALDVSGELSATSVSFSGSMQIPNDATPTTDATGELALDTTITDHQPLLQYYDGGENMTVIAIDTSELPALDNEIVKYDAATDKFVLESDGGAGISNVVEDVTPQLGGDLDAQGNNITSGGVIFLTEQADADADVAGQGQIWVNTATPNELWFTDDAGTDFQLGVETNDLETDGATNIADTEIFIGTGAGTGNYAAMSGDATMTNAGVVAIGTSVVVTGDIANDTITHADIADADQSDTKCFYFEDPTADDDFNSIWANKTANDFLLTEIWAESDQTVNFDLQVDDGTPADVNGTDISPAAGEAEDTSLSGDTTVAAGEELDLAITSVSGTPTWVSICFTGNWVD